MKYILTIVATIATLCASAQTLPVGIIKEGADVTINEIPSSTIFVDVTLTQTTFTAGIYARYAQKYLGERAPLINRELTTISSSSVTLAPQDYYIGSLEVAPEVTTSKSPASTLPINVTSAEITVPEVAAAAAAKQIFDNRKLCNDLIAGNIGESVYGAGLVAALDRLDRIERECVALFMGSETTTTTTSRFVINVQSNTKRYMICRFDSSHGVLSANEIEGDPVYLQITPASVTDSTYTMTLSKTPRQKSFVAANRSLCDLYVGANIITSSVLPLYEFGERTTIIYDPK